MSGKKLTMCELWDWTPPTPVLHSRLYHLEPIGVGTMYVESLTSYMTRLARAHVLPVRELAVHEIAPLLDQRYAPEFVTRMFSHESRVLNGISPWTAKAIWTLEKLTGRTELAFLTLWAFSTVLSNEGLIRSVQAWCPSCYQDWRQAGQRVYNPLLWALQAITVCPQHNQPLQVRCPDPACQASVPFLASRSEIGYCPQCQRWLGATTPAQGEATLGRDELEPAVWKAQATGELLAATPYLTTPLSTARVAEVLLAYMASTPAQSAVGLAFRAGLPASRLRTYLRKPHTLRLDHWLDACWRLGLSPFHTLIDPETIEPNRRSNIDWVQALRAEFDEPSPSLDFAEIEEILTALSTSDEKPPPSLNDVARRVKRSCDTLRHHFPELCEVIVERQRAYHRNDKLRTQRELEALLNTSPDPLPTLGEVAQHLGQSKDFLRHHFPELCCAITERRRAYQEAEELRVQRALEAVVKANENPPPTVGEVARQLEQPENFLYKHFPELCRTLVERQRAYDEAETRCLRFELEAILTTDENPPPTLREVAQRLDRTESCLRHRFPELCHTLTERQRVYEADMLRVRRGLEVVLSAGETPPPSLNEVARRLERSDHFLRRHFPEQCNTLVEQRRAYQESEKSRLRQALEAILVSSEQSLSSLNEVAQQLEQPKWRLRSLFPDLCRAFIAQLGVHPAKHGSGQDDVVDQPKVVEKQPQSGLDARTLQLRQQLEIIVASDETPPLSLDEVARRLGSSDTTLNGSFPDLCQAIVQRCKAYQEAERLHLQHELEVILASDEAPPPPLREVARRLGSSNTALSRSFPDLCQAIIQRCKAYQEAKRLNLEHELEAVLASDEAPPPFLREVAQRLGSTDTALSRSFPDLCQAIIQRRKAYQEAERLHLQRELEVILASDQVPPLSWPEVACQLEQPDSMLLYYFPDLYRAIVERYQTYQQTEKLTLQCKLEATLAVDEEPVPSLRDIARRLGYSYDSLRRLFPELCQRISARYLADAKARAARKMEQLRMEIRQATFEIWRNGSYPTRSRVASRLSTPGDFRKSDLVAIWREALHELGLSE